MTSITRKMRKIGIIILFMVSYAVVPVLQAQKVYKVLPAGNTLTIKGTSNLHEWESKAQQITGDLSADAGDKTLTRISEVTLKVPVSSIKSGKGIMDNKTYDALKNDKYPNITYHSTNFTIRGNEITSVGQLTIAGNAQVKTLTTTYTVNPDGRISVKGGFKLKMSDFNISPPTALMGTLKTGNDVDVQFELFFK